MELHKMEFIDINDLCCYGTVIHVCSDIVSCQPDVQSFLKQKT